MNTEKRNKKARKKHGKPEAKQKGGKENRGIQISENKK